MLGSIVYGAGAIGGAIGGRSHTTENEVSDRARGAISKRSATVGSDWSTPTATRGCA
jgi:hypothetical protein